MKIISRVLIAFLINILYVFAVGAQSATIECGDILQGELTPDNPILDFTLLEPPGTTLTGRVEPIGDGLNVWVELRDSGGNIFAWFNERNIGGAEPIYETTISSTNSVLRVTGANPGAGGTGQWASTGNYYGAFVIHLGCIRMNGEVVSPGSPPPEPTLTTLTPSIPEFSGFGFPGVAPVDFSAGIEIPLSAGQGQTAPIASDVALYTYEGSAGSAATLSIARVSGDISIGVAVIHRDSNEIVFLGGMPASNNLSVELNFPADGTYAIGIFRLDTATRSGTSGAVQITIE